MSLIDFVPEILSACGRTGRQSVSALLLCGLSVLIDANFGTMIAELRVACGGGTDLSQALRSQLGRSMPRGRGAAAARISRRHSAPPPARGLGLGTRAPSRAAASAWRAVRTAHGTFAGRAPPPAFPSTCRIRGRASAVLSWILPRPCRLHRHRPARNPRPPGVVQPVRCPGRPAAYGAGRPVQAPGGCLHQAPSFRAICAGSLPPSLAFLSFL